MTPEDRRSTDSAIGGWPALPHSLVEEAVRAALAEDIGRGDITTATTVPAEARAHACMVAREAGIIAGLPIAAATFALVDPRVSVTPLCRDGDAVEPGSIVCIADGPARGILTAERTALNFVQRLSGIATLTSRFVRAVAGTGARIVDTRKTTPGLRVFEKYAVAVGGGRNHRFGLDDAVLIKDNHIVAAGGISAAVARARAAIPHTMTITVECDTLDQLNEALEAGADIVMLDNMDASTLAQAIGRAKGRARIEVSGGISLETAHAIAAAGAEILSVGALTHSAPALDAALDFAPPGEAT